MKPQESKLASLVFLVSAILAGVSWSAIPEAGIFLYGRVTDSNQQVVTAGQLRWTFTPPAASPVSVTVSLGAIRGPNGETFSYSLFVPAESVLPGDTLSQGTVAYPANPITYTRSATLNGQPLYFNTPGEEASRQYVVDDHRGGAFRIDLGLADCNQPAAPASVAASDDEFADRVRVVWDPVVGATSYEIWRNLENDCGAAAKWGQAAFPPFDDFSAIPGTPCYYWVRAMNDCGPGTFGPVDTGTRFGAPPTPTPVIPLSRAWMLR